MLVSLSLTGNITKYAGDIDVKRQLGTVFSNDVNICNIFQNVAAQGKRRPSGALCLILSGTVYLLGLPARNLAAPYDPNLMTELGNTDSMLTAK